MDEQRFKEAVQEWYPFGYGMLLNGHPYTTIVAGNTEWLFSLHPDSISIFNEGPNKECTIKIHDCELPMVLPRLHAWTGGMRAKEAFPALEFWPDGRYFNQWEWSNVTVNAYLAAIHHSSRDSYTFVKDDRADEAVAKLANLGEKVDILVRRMQRCPTLRDIGDAACAKLLMSGSIDIGALLQVCEQPSDAHLWLHSQPL